MKIDLNEDFKKVYEFLEHRVNDFDAASNIGPKPGTSKVSMIEIGYQFDQAGWVAVVFDARARGEPDGEWTLCIEGNALEMDHWFEAIDQVFETNEAVEVISLDGSSRLIDQNSDGEDYSCFGEMLKQVLHKARSSGLLERLPLADRCIMGVEEINGSYGWPAYDDRETEGNARAA